MDTIETAAKRLGVEPAARQLHARAIEAALPSEVSIEIDDHTARFHIGSQFEYDQFTQYLNGPDRAVLRDFLDRLQKEDIVWDIGANVGVYTCFAAARLDSELVIAIEPHPSNCARIGQNLELNNQRATIQPYAISSSRGEMTLTETGPHVAGTYGRLHRAETPSHGEEQNGVIVEVINGDSLTESDRLPQPTVLKIDIQGSEQDGLDGLRKTLSDERCRLVYCNVYEKHFESPTQAAETTSLIQETGLEPTRIQDWDGGYFLRAERT